MFVENYLFLLIDSSANPVKMSFSQQIFWIVEKNTAITDNIDYHNKRMSYLIILMKAVRIHTKIQRALLVLVLHLCMKFHEIRLAR